MLSKSQCFIQFLRRPFQNANAQTASTLAASAVADDVTKRIPPSKPLVVSGNVKTHPVREL